MDSASLPEADRKFLERLTSLIQKDQLDLPPFPDIARELDDLLKESSTDIIQIARVVERDPGMVKRVWVQARSAMYATQPRSLHHAVARVGLDALWRIGMSVCLNDTVFRVEGFQHLADKVRTHGVVTAEVSAGLAGERRGNFYMAGLLHNVGRLIIIQVASKNNAQLPSTKLVDDVANACHAGLGVLVAHSWKLEQSVAGAIGYHSQPTKAPHNMQRMAKVVAASQIAAHAAELSIAGITLQNADPVKEIAELGFDAHKAIERATTLYEAMNSTDDNIEDDDTEDSGAPAPPHPASQRENKTP